MNAKYLLLNHFSQRYPKLPRIQPFDPESEQKRPIIALAFDLMSVPLKSFSTMETYNDAFQALFQEMAEADPESGDEEDAPSKPSEKSKGKKVKGKQANDVQGIADSQQPVSNRQRRRQERLEGSQSGKALNDTRKDCNMKSANGKRSLPDGEGEDMAQKGLKRSKSDASEKLSVALDNLAPL